MTAVSSDRTGGKSPSTHQHFGRRRGVGAIVLIGVLVTAISICTARDTAAEEPKGAIEAQEVRAEIQQLHAPLLLSVEVIPDAATESVNATQSGDGGVAPSAVGPEATKPHDAP